MIGAGVHHPVAFQKAQTGDLSQGDQRGFFLVDQKNAADAHAAEIWLVQDDRRLAEAVEGGDHLV